VKPFRFCPACGTRLPAEPDAEGGRECPACGRVWYRSFSPTAGAAIVRDDRALVTVRAREPEKGRIDVPGGFLRLGEKPVDALKREVQEELGIELEASVEDCLQMVPHRYGKEGDWVLALGFAARLVGHDHIEPGDDVAEAKWVTEAELDELDFAWEHDRELIRKALRHG
jgi:NADH pyrophosphatase NudC (nudix superfamily)